MGAFGSAWMELRSFALVHIQTARCNVMARYSPGYDSRPRRVIGATIDTLPDVIKGMQRVQGWLEVCARNGIVVPAEDLERLHATIERIEARYAGIREYCARCGADLTDLFPVGPCPNCWKAEQLDSQ